MTVNQWRNTLDGWFDDADYDGLIVNSLIGSLVLLSAGIFVAQTYSLPTRISKFLDTADTAIQIIFIAEYLVRLWLAQNRWKYVTNVYAIVDLLAIIPFFLVSFDTRFVRLLKWFRILRLIRVVAKIKNEDTLILTRIFFTILSIIFIFSGLIYQIEHIANPRQFNTFLDAVYFSVVTMTTVGYGDMTPASEGGKLLTVLMILTGIALIPVQLGEAFQRLFQNANKRSNPCNNCGLAVHDFDAAYCKACGNKL
jgi:voltage-gated potassium channel